MDLPTREPTKSEVAIVQNIKEKYFIYLLDLFTLFQLSLFIYDQGKATGYFTCSPAQENFDKQ